MLLGVCSWEEPRSALDSGTVLPSTWSCYLQLPSQLAFPPGAWGPVPSLAMSSLSSLCPSPPLPLWGPVNVWSAGDSPGLYFTPLPTSPEPPPLPTRMGLCQELDPVCRVLTATPRGAETQRGSATHPRTQPLQDSVCSDRLRLHSLHPRGVHWGSVHTRPLLEGPPSYVRTRSLSCV